MKVPATGIVFYWRGLAARNSPLIPSGKRRQQQQQKRAQDRGKTPAVDQPKPLRLPGEILQDQKSLPT